MNYGLFAEVLNPWGYLPVRLERMGMNVRKRINVGGFAEREVNAVTWNGIRSTYSSAHDQPATFTMLYFLCRRGSDEIPTRSAPVHERQSP